MGIPANVSFRPNMAVTTVVVSAPILLRAGDRASELEKPASSDCRPVSSERLSSAGLDRRRLMLRKRKRCRVANHKNGERHGRPRGLTRGNSQNRGPKMESWNRRKGQVRTAIGIVIAASLGDPLRARPPRRGRRREVVR